jgi:Protein of unknown function (DUF2868)
MNERALRTVLLVQAIEETDPAGEVLPLADRVEATRSVVGNGPVPPESAAEASLSSATEWFLTRRAELLLAKLRTRSPGLDHVLAIAGGATWLDRALLVLAFSAGAGLAFLDGTHRLNIFAYPLLCLLVWNLFVYVLLVSRAFRGERPDGLRIRFWFGNFYATWVRGQIDALLGHSTRFNAPLAPGLRRFAGDWWEIAQPLFVLRARRLLHLAAALFALGLVAGFYVEGFLLRYPAGWDGTLLGPPTARALLVALYGPASAFTGTPIPSAESIGALRWTGAGGGGDAADWVHLIAWTAVLYIVLPRLFAAVVTTVALWRRSRSLEPPASLSSYARSLFANMEN